MKVASLVLPLVAVCSIVLSNKAVAQTPGAGSVTLAGSEQGPIYPCGRKTCPTYDSGQIKILVNGYTASASYSNSKGRNTGNGLANTLASYLNRSSSPVRAVVSNTKITLTSKAKGANTNYPLSTAVTHNSRFKAASFSATPSGATLTGGTDATPPPPPPPPVPIGTLLLQTSNNTSACSSPDDPGGNRPYCFDYYNGNVTNPADTQAQTVVVNSPAGHVSNVSLHTLMDANWGGKFICEYQPWFGLSSHLSVGYNENSAFTVAAQNSAMIAQGCDINFIDWYGSTSPNQTFNLTTSNQVFADLNSRPGYPLKFSVMEDKDGLKYSCPISGKTESDTLTCLENALIIDMDYIHANYAGSPAYWIDGGKAVVGSFVTQSQWPVLTSSDWTTVWNAVKAHTDSYDVPFKYIFQYGSFTNAAYDNGRFAWVKPAHYSATAQMWWGSDTGTTPTYLDSFYSAARAHSSQLAIGAVFKGFDDNNASWGGNRVVAQQCGQVLLNTVKEAAKYFGGSNPQIPYMQVVTWNDYEEATAVESGIDNCYTVNATLSGSTLNWSLVASDSSYASPSTIHHFTVYFADATGNLYLAADNLPVTATSFDLSNVVPAGTWSVYVEMVGQPLILNRMSNPQTYIK